MFLKSISEERKYFYKSLYKRKSHTVFSDNLETGVIECSNIRSYFIKTGITKSPITFHLSHETTLILFLNPT